MAVPEYWNNNRTRSALSCHTLLSRVGSHVISISEGRQVADIPVSVLALTIPAAFFAAIDVSTKWPV